MREPLPVPRRIWISGACAAGKSTLARRVADVLAVDPTHMDDIHWQPGWVEAPRERTAAALAAIAARPSWVIDGNYGMHRRNHLDAPDLFLWLDFPLHVVMPRLLKRSFLRSVRGDPCCNGNRESFARSFFTRDSILLWEWNEHDRRRRELESELRGRPHVRLCSQIQVDAWLRRFRQSADG